MNTATQNSNKPVLTAYREVRIGKTIYRLTSRFEGNKNVNDTLKRLAVKRATRAAN